MPTEPSLQKIEPNPPITGREVYRPETGVPLREFEITMKVRVPNGVSMADLKREVRRAVFEHAAWAPKCDVLCFGVRSVSVVSANFLKGKGA